MRYSFIIPVYNCKAYLAACVETIRAVDAVDCEILLVDDGSSDGSGALCDALATQYPEIRVVHQENAGASAARNRGIREARGEMILFLDADDSVDAETLSEILRDARCQEADLTIFGLTFDYYRKGKCYRRDPLFYEYDGMMDRGTWGTAFEQLYRDNSLSPVWNKVFKREILVQHQLELNTDMFLYEDFEFVLRYMKYCEKIWNVPKAVYHYRQTEDEGNAKRRLARIDCLSEFLKPIERALDELQQNNLFISARQRDLVLQQLYLVLAGEKISVSNFKEIRQICRGFFAWSAVHDMPMEESQFQSRLLSEKVFMLWLADKKTMVRHAVAVRVKALLHRQ